MPGAARLNDIGKGDPHAHGCPACPHLVQGPITIGSTTVFINSLPAARVGDIGISAACCGPNMFELSMGSSTVFIDGKAAVRKDDDIRQCMSFTGKVITGSPDVIIGD
jgi:uncharacterized Zn-binding protein involved in type VI secretion